MVTIDLATLSKPHPSKWVYPLHLLREDGHELVCISGLDRSVTRTFLRKHNLFNLFDDILYNPEETSSEVKDLRHLPPLCRHQWTRLRLSWAIEYTA